jgi:hypothetical protein
VLLQGAVSAEKFEYWRDENDEDRNYVYVIAT